MINPDPDRWIELGEAFQRVGRRLFDTAWTGSELTIDDQALLWRFTNDAEEQRRADAAWAELRRTLYNAKIPLIYIASRDGRAYKLDHYYWFRGDIVVCIVHSILEPSVTRMGGAPGRGLILIDRKVFLQALPAKRGGQKELRKWLEDQGESAPPMRKEDFLHLAQEDYGVGRAAALRLRAESAPAAWRQPGRRRSSSH